MDSVGSPETPDAARGGVAGTIIDVPFKGDVFSAGAVVVIAIIGGCIGGIVAATTVSGAASNRSFVVAAVVCATGLAVSLSLGFRQRAQARARRLAAESDLPDIAPRLQKLMPKIRGMFGSYALVEIAKRLALEGRYGATVRIAAEDQADPIEPMDVPFEPRLLESGFSKHGSNAALVDDPMTVSRRVRRNLLLKGGWIIVVAFVLNFGFAAIDAYRQWRITLPLIAWSLAFVAVLFLPARWRWAAGKQWLVVPGGLILRKSSWRSDKWRLHVFDRTRAVLLIYKLRRHQWALCVADDQESDSAVGTKEELEFALRAWLSPLGPPPVERLSDLR